ncbi:MAG: ThiF family adenylyltransferase [Deltaproteobacteria bacterium]|nr:ThiF family adenylyltransferase [Deltaproteobacteria bacterium]
MSSRDRDGADRYSRQKRFAGLGPAGHDRIRQGRAVLVGCGALGSSIANALVRAGVGRLTLIDDDLLETSNLQRQTLFDERQARAQMPKVEAARERLAQINRDVDLRAIEARVTPETMSDLVGRPDVVLDGTDRFLPRYLINDYCVREAIPWIHGGCAACQGQVMPVLPGVTPCLRCIFPEIPGEEDALNADTLGILGPIAHLVASLQAIEALKILSGRRELVRAVLHAVDPWASRLATISLSGPEPQCPCCGQRRFDFLEPEEAR